MIIDISPLVSERIGVWPGDVPYRRRVGQAMALGDNLDLGSIETTLHVGAHADAPSHYERGAHGISERPLDLYYGPCRVVEVKIPRGARIDPEHLTEHLTADPGAPRVLFKTGSFPDPETFSTDFNSLSPALVDLLHDRGVRLVGIDTPSVDPFDDSILLAHHALARHDMANLEGLLLRGVAPGLYTLIALPLRLEGADASPVRAALLAHS